MQTAMGLTPQRPTQRTRFGELPEGLSGEQPESMGITFNEKPAGTFLVILPAESLLALVNIRL
jgi:hypothetical protein